MFATNPGLAKTDLNYYAGDTVLYTNLWIILTPVAWST